MHVRMSVHVCVWVCVRQTFDSPYFPGCRALHAHTHTHTHTHTQPHRECPGPAVLMKQPVSSYLHYIQSSGQCQQLHCSFPLSELTHLYTHTRCTNIYTNTHAQSVGSSSFLSRLMLTEADARRTSCSFFFCGGGGCLAQVQLFKTETPSLNLSQAHHHHISSTASVTSLSLSLLASLYVGAEESLEARGGGGGVCLIECSTCHISHISSLIPLRHTYMFMSERGKPRGKPLEQLEHSGSFFRDWFHCDAVS